MTPEQMEPSGINTFPSISTGSASPPVNASPVSFTLVWRVSYNVIFNGVPEGIVTFTIFGLGGVFFSTFFTGSDLVSAGLVSGVVVGCSVVVCPNDSSSDGDCSLPACWSWLLLLQPKTKKVATVKSVKSLIVFIFPPRFVLYRKKPVAAKLISRLKYKPERLLRKQNRLHFYYRQ